MFTLNLRTSANMGFFDATAGDGKGGWADEGPLNCLAAMPVGRQTLYGVPFDVIDPRTNGGRAIVTLRGKNATPRHPLSVENIPIGQDRVRVLYFLHSSAWGAPGTIGRYVVHYAGGQTVTIPITIPVNCANWWNGYAQGEESRPVPIRVTNTADGKPAWRYVRVREWQNPRPAVRLESLDLVSEAGASTPILLAVTGSDREPMKPSLLLPPCRCCSCRPPGRKKRLRQSLSLSSQARARRSGASGPACSGSPPPPSTTRRYPVPSR